MLTDLKKVHKIEICTGYTDMRKSTNGLISIIRGEFGNEIEPGTLYLFCGRSAKKMKCLYRDTDSYVLVHKEMDTVRFKWPRSVRELREMDPVQFQCLLRGFTVV